jgi:dihydroorotase
VFERAGVLDRLEAFASSNGPAFYGLAPNTDKITLQRRKWKVPAAYAYGDDTLVPLFAGKTLDWEVSV